MKDRWGICEAINVASVWFVFFTHPVLNDPGTTEASPKHLLSQTTSVPSCSLEQCKSKSRAGDSE